MRARVKSISGPLKPIAYNNNDFVGYGSERSQAGPGRFAGHGVQHGGISGRKLLLDTGNKALVTSYLTEMRASK